MKYSRDIQHDYQPPEPRDEFSRLFKDVIGAMGLFGLVLVIVYLLLAR